MKRIFLFLILILLIVSCSSQNVYIQNNTDVEKNVQILLEKQSNIIKPFDYYEYYKWNRPTSF